MLYNRKPKNQILSDSFKTSLNFYLSDMMLQDWLSGNLSAVGLAFMHDKLVETGKAAAGIMNQLSLDADKNPPQLIRRDQYGEDKGHIKFHPSYNALLKIAVDSGMMSVKWDTDNRKKFAGEHHRLGFSTGFLFAMSELGQYCPLCMTDGVARLIDRYAKAEDADRLLPRIGTENVDEFYTGAMFLTEKSGGSDVGANLVSARHAFGDYYHLNGEKWFCSNANADLIMALARTDRTISGTKGLSIFLIEKHQKDGNLNPMPVIRLKDKLGVRSMASAEVILQDTVGKIIGKPFEGFRIMADMINLSRLYNSVAAIAGSRRALIEAYQFLCHRVTFGKFAIEHALVRQKLFELGAMQTANFYLTWRVIKALDLADEGNLKEAKILRLLTPMAKRCTADDGVYIVRESMELMGGLGYIEDTVMPKIMRDMMVLPIWEGAGNIMVLDMLRAALRSEGLSVLLAEVENQVKEANLVARSFVQLKIDINQVLQIKDRDKLEFSSKAIFMRLTDFTKYGLLRENTSRREQSVDGTCHNVPGKPDTQKRKGSEGACICQHYSWLNGLESIIMKALLLIDIQNDFCPGGALGVHEGDKVIPVANEMMNLFDLIIATKDWHPANHKSFAAMHPWRRPGQVIELNGLQQVLWPIHCVQESFGSEFFKGLETEKIHKIFYKGTDPEVDSYSGFFDNGKRKSTGLSDFLQKKGINEVYILGLATDYCVKFTALDSVDAGFNTYVILEGCRGVNLNPGDDALAISEMESKNIKIIRDKTELFSKK